MNQLFPPVSASERPHSEPVRFAGALGFPLAGRLTLPAAGEPRAFALFAHCFTCGKDLKGSYHLAGALASAGIATLRFDFTGLGSSGGDFADTTFSSNVADLQAAAAFLATRHRAPALLIGHSLGGAAVLQAACDLPSCRAVATIAAPFEPGAITRELLGLDEALASRDGTEVLVAGRRYTIRRQFLDDLERHEPQRSIRELGRALLVLHSPFDRTVPIGEAARIFEAARHPKSFVSLDRADHILSDPHDARYAGEVIAAWASRYLGDDP